ncbi:MAG: hypothetical protein Dasosvirus13_7 [Dasosvirus sp.]|uniref:Uncharacterized protein n=1 Tax=Dasosvirus sp. TaxID=2487764 RepID=A0A3G4ZUE6_9VIRU|nr:MAG: hypothetical protein Dasosvirus13_7 [Dasosvirus sp.]
MCDVKNYDGKSRPMNAEEQVAFEEWARNY